jgi:hypothetical protein
MKMLVVTRCLMIDDGEEKNLLSKELINKPVQLMLAVTMLLLLVLWKAAVLYILRCPAGRKGSPGLRPFLPFPFPVDKALL